jgi:hypothetical protein
MDGLGCLASNARVAVRRSGEPDGEGKCVVYWMQRAQRALDNPALEIAVKAANLLNRSATCRLIAKKFDSKRYIQQMEELK